MSSNDKGKFIGSKLRAYLHTNTHKKNAEQLSRSEGEHDAKCTHEHRKRERKGEKDRERKKESKRERKRGRVEVYPRRETAHNSLVANNIHLTLWTIVANKPKHFMRQGKSRLRDTKKEEKKTNTKAKQIRKMENILCRVIELKIFRLA